jgi:hypothetical protein
VLSSAERKEKRQRELDRLRAHGIDPFELMKSLSLFVLNSGKTFTNLLPTEAELDEEDLPDVLPEDLEDRFIGLSLDNNLLGHLPIDDSGKLLPDAKVPVEAMTVGGTPILVDWDGEHLTLTDPSGVKAVVRSVVGRGPKMLVCSTDKTLMYDEWFGEKPVRKSGRSVGLDESRYPSERSLIDAFGEWDAFERPSKQGGLIHVRSQLSREGVRARALKLQLFQVRFELPEGEVIADDEPRFRRAINRLEDRIALKIALKKPQTTPVAVVTNRNRYDFYYCAEDSSALTGALKGMSARPFTRRIAHLTGDTALLLDWLVPPDAANK